MKKQFLLYYPFKFDKVAKVEYGSGHRIKSIYYAFVEYCNKHDIELIFISGNQNERYKMLRKLFTESNENLIGCYIELPNIPLILSNSNHIPTNPYCDFYLFKKCKENNIPVGIFLRDIHWKFKEYKSAGLTQRISQIFSEYYLKYYKKHADIMFLPSLTMNKYVGFNNKIYALPSGGAMKNKIYNNYRDNQFKGIFVGSLHDSSNIENLLKAFDLFNQKVTPMSLNLVCRVHEFQNLEHLFTPYMNSKWLKIYHVSGDDLNDIYFDSDFAIMPHKKSIYIDFAMPVKLMEYLSFGMPILSTNIYEVSKFIKSNNYGIISKDDSYNAIYNSLNEMHFMLSNNQFDKVEIYNNFILKNKWTDRVDEIITQLEEVK
ncbi:glycosyltransferase [Macrococcoides canis]|uniref:glycosyltransferase n=1 Tax=Macrococcoides canis TaxID=1855823 RepID=UPI001AEBF1E8|nr:glycosyltransferase [Macrococcus canis]QTQ08963.1 glycosyltransferase [Macrococcus canis]